jgi:hypothetical protein
LHFARGGSARALPAVVREINAKWNAIVRRVEALYPGRAIGIERDIVKRATVLALATMVTVEGEEAPKVGGVFSFSQEGVGPDSGAPEIEALPEKRL